MSIKANEESKLLRNSNKKKQVKIIKFNKKQETKHRNIIYSSTQQHNNKDYQHFLPVLSL